MKIHPFKINTANLLPVLAVTLIFIICCCGGCGGSGETRSASMQAYLYGEMHGDMRQAIGESIQLSELTELGNFSTASADRMLIISKPTDGLTANETNSAAAAAKTVLEAGHAVALEHVNQSEINNFLHAVGSESMDILHAAGSPDIAGENVEIFAIEQRGGHNFYFVAMDGTAEPLISADREERTFVISGDEDRVNSEVVTQKSTVSEDKPGHLSDNEIQNGRVEELLNWAANGENRLNALNLAKAANSAENDLRELAEADVWDINCSDSGQTFTIRYTVYSCHSFNENKDYFLISQSAQLNPSVLWKRTQEGHVRWPNIYEPKQQGHMRRYLFKNYWGEIPSVDVPIVKQSPPNANNSSSVTSGFSWSASGSVGFAGMGATGSLSSGISFSSSQTFTIDDCTVHNNCGAGRADMAQWGYEFANPATGTPHFYWSELRDAPMLSRANFQPVNQWIWVVPRTFVDKWPSLNFLSEFSWTNGKSEGQINCLAIKVYDAVHKDWSTKNNKFWVPLKKPPLMAVNKSQMDFTKNGESKTFNFVSAKAWSAASNQTWCTVQEQSGVATSATGETIHITADKNSSGANREAVVTLKSTDGKESCIIKIFQSHY
ncbi:MAG: BACON domain-containing protein [Synergistaceae bacterium]